MGGRMQSQAHRGCREGRRAWSTGCRRGGLEGWTQEGGGPGQAKGKHGVRGRERGHRGLRGGGRGGRLAWQKRTWTP